ncbi:MAG TPA: hypothetical protein VEY30_12930, partial [Myxococcaceae bacterium]|nr:hypothetical protein [Myxococcaceae bacterium]
AATAALDGAAFHFGMNLFNMGRGKGERADWSAQAFARSGLVTGLCSATRARSATRKAALADKLVGSSTSAKLGWRALEYGQHLGEEVGAASSTAIAESYIRTGDLSQARKILADNLQFIIAMQMFHGAEALVKKSGILNRDPAPEDPLQELKRKAAELDAERASDVERVNLLEWAEAIPDEQRRQIRAAIDQYGEKLTDALFPESSRATSKETIKRDLATVLDPLQSPRLRAEALQRLPETVVANDLLYGSEQGRFTQEFTSRRRALDGELVTDFDKAQLDNAAALKQLTYQVQGTGSLAAMLVHLARGLNLEFDNPTDRSTYFFDVIAGSDQLALIKGLLQPLGDGKGAFSATSLLAEPKVQRVVQGITHHLGLPSDFNPAPSIDALIETFDRLQSENPRLHETVARTRWDESRRLSGHTDPYVVDFDPKGKAGTIGQTGDARHQATGEERFYKLWFPETVEKFQRGIETLQGARDIGLHLPFFEGSPKRAARFKLAMAVTSSLIERFKIQTNPYAEAVNAIERWRKTQYNPHVAPPQIYEVGPYHLIMEKVANAVSLGERAELQGVADTARRHEQYRKREAVGSFEAARERARQAVELFHGIEAIDRARIQVEDPSLHSDRVYSVRLDLSGLGFNTGSEAICEVQVDKGTGDITPVGRVPDLSEGSLQRVLTLHNIETVLSENADPTKNNSKVMEDGTHRPLDYGAMLEFTPRQLAAPGEFALGWETGSPAIMAKALIDTLDTQRIPPETLVTYRDRLRAHFSESSSRGKSLLVTAMGGLEAVGEHNLSGNYGELFRALASQVLSNYSFKREHFRSPEASIVQGYAEARPDLIARGIASTSPDVLGRPIDERNAIREKLETSFTKLTGKYGNDFNGLIHKLDEVLVNEHKLSPVSPELKTRLQEFFESAEARSQDSFLWRTVMDSRLAGEEQFLSAGWSRNEALAAATLSSFLPTRSVNRRFKEAHVRKLSGQTGQAPPSLSHEPRRRLGRRRDGDAGEAVHRRPLPPVVPPRGPQPTAAPSQRSLEPEVRVLSTAIGGLGAVLTEVVTRGPGVAATPWIAGSMAMGAAAVSLLQTGIREGRLLLRRETSAEEAFRRMARDGGRSLVLGGASGLAASLAGAVMGSRTSSGLYRSMATFFAGGAAFMSSELAARTRAERRAAVRLAEEA